MYFKQIAEIVNGTKTQTRRVCKDGESYFYLAANGRQYRWEGTLGVPHATDLETIHEVYTPSGRLKWQAGRDYAVQPGRGKPGVWWMPSIGRWSQPEPYIQGDASWKPLRIKLLEIRREPLQAISEADAVAEGYPAKWPPPTMAAVHDGFISMFKFPQDDPVTWYRKLWKTINGPKSWDTNPNVWCLTFEVVR